MCMDLGWATGLARQAEYSVAYINSEPCKYQISESKGKKSMPSAIV